MFAQFNPAGCAAFALFSLASLRGLVMGLNLAEFPMQRQTIGVVVSCCALLGACNNSGPEPAPSTGIPHQGPSASQSGTTVATIDLKPGGASETYRIEATEPVWIGYEVLAGLSESDIPDPGATTDPSKTEIVRIDRLGEVKPGNVGGLASSSLAAATELIPQDGFVEVRVFNLSDRQLKVRLFKDHR